MLRNFITIALRNFLKFRFYTLINILGLTIGITVCLIILLFIRFELSYDRYNANADRIVRIDWDLKMGETRTYNAAVTPPMAEVFVRDLPEVEAAARFRYMGSFQFKRDVENTVEWRVVYADNDVFKIFTIPFIQGNPATALKEPNSMVITEQCAAQFFPNENALGKTLMKDNETLYTITGVVNDIPENSHFHYRMFLSMEGLDESKNGNWIGGPFNTYLLLRPEADPTALEAKLPGIVNQYLLPYAESVLGASFMDKFKADGNQLKLRVRPLTDIHLHSNLRNELEGNGDIDYVYLFGAIAAFTLIIACINFMNLATARSARRAREVGMRKVMGSNRFTLALQFIGESTMLSLLAFVIALGLTDVLLPAFNSLTGMNLKVPFQNVALGLGVFAAALLVGVLSGIYPGLVLSSFQPAHVLKGKLTGNGSSSLRSGLVVFQFTVSIFLIIGTMALHQQMNYLKSKKLGFNQEQVILLRDVKNMGDRLTTIRDEMLNTTKIKSGTVSSYFPGPGSARNTPLMWKFGSAPLPENSFNAEKWSVDYEYVNTLGIEIIEGRNFSRNFPSDSSAVILNEAAVARLGFSDSPVGHKISMFHQNDDGSQDQTRLETWEIIGVARNFNFESLRQNVTPLGLFFGISHGALAFRYESENTQEVINTLESKWKVLAPGEPFHYSFLDQNFQSMYNTEAKVSKLFAAFAGLAIIIACMGLFALTAYTAEQRTKEIGIRKVMGASVQNIILLLTRDFGKLIAVGFLLATPLAAYSIRWYLQDYAYRASISWWIYLAAGIVTFFLALLTMGYQSIVAAKTNPVEALKSE
ncbi:MAG: ABC transporter permease [Cyclobacteriaceae bacterium]|nr:ABC transporter permease [Cyclobacteriaceae bacterium]